ncbi:MAG: ATP-binding protein [Acidobacteriaceae bacterium]
MTARENELRVLVVAPTGRDGPMICNLLAGNGLACVSSGTSEAARMELKAGAGAIVMAEEVLTLPEIAAWAAQVSEQPSWSDLPLLLLTAAGAVNGANLRKALARKPLGNVILLERPVRPETLISAMQAALRSRGRQYQVRDFMAERLVAEQALRRAEKLAVAARLAASFSHEINNPLAAVTNLLYLIGVSSSLDETQEYAEIATRELTRVSEIVTRNLRFHKESIKPGAVEITEVVNAALNLYQVRLATAKISIERDFRECSPIVGVGGELRQLIVNLIANALDAIGHGGTLKIRIAATHERSNGSRPGVRVTIGDSGSGIRPEIRNTLFEPFVSTKGNTGTGLGLWVSSEIVRRHGGTIQVKSRVNSSLTGTVFSIFLPSHHNWTPSRHGGEVQDCGCQTLLLAD